MSTKDSKFKEAIRKQKRSKLGGRRAISGNIVPLFGTLSTMIQLLRIFEFSDLLLFLGTKIWRREREPNAPSSQVVGFTDKFFNFNNMG